MRTKDVLKVLCGSVVVYGIMAACGSSGGNHVTGFEREAGLLDALLGDVVTGMDQDGSGGADVTGADSPSLMDRVGNPIPDAVADVNTSGSRLKAKYYAGSDGSKLYQGIMFDTQLQMDCYFAFAADDQTRCIPVGVTGVASDIGYYADASCTQALGGVAKGCAAPKYLERLEIVTTVCPNHGRYHFLGISGPFVAATVYVKSGNQCISQAPSAAYDLYIVGAEAPATDFVAATVQTDP